MSRRALSGLLLLLPLAGCGGGGSSPIPPAAAADAPLATAPVGPATIPGGPHTIRGDSVPGGLRGNVNSSLTVQRTAVPGTLSFEWALVGILDNHASAGENVAVYGQANARSSGPTWAGVLEVVDRSPAALPNMVGLEVNMGTARPHNGNQLGVHTVAHGAGSGTSAFVADGGSARWESAYRAQGKVNVLLDLWRAQEATVFADLPMPLLQPASGRHAGNIPVSIGGQTYFLPVYR